MKHMFPIKAAAKLPLGKPGSAMGSIFIIVVNAENTTQIMTVRSKMNV